MSFLTPDEAFLRAAEADPGLKRESFLEQVRSAIARGALRASGFRFQEKRMSTAIAPTPPFELFSVPMVQKFASRERVEIPPLAMVDYSGPGYDGRIVRDEGADIDGWEDVRLQDNLAEPSATVGSRGPYESGQRVKQALSKCFPRIPSKVEMPDSDLVRFVQAKHEELSKGAPTPDRKTILFHAGRLTRK